MKRFTETDKWRDSWFRELPPTTKLAYLFILDNADLAGVWDPDFKLANFQIGLEVDWIGVQRDLGDRLEILENGKWWITRFIAFQYGELSEDCRPHMAVLRQVKANGIKLKGSNRVSKQYPKGQGQGQGQGPRQGPRQGQGPEEGSGGKPPEATPEERLYAVYPRKVAKQDALRAIAKALQSQPFETLLPKVEAYAAAVARWPEEDRRWVPHPATWFNRGSYDDDPKTWERKTPGGAPTGATSMDRAAAAKLHGYTY